MENTFGNNVASFSLVRDMLLEGNDVTVKVQGTSMLPFFRSGSIITLRPVKEKDLKKYSVVFADAGTHFVIHRIIDISRTYVTLLGDGNVYGTEIMTKNKVYGVIDCSPLHLFLARIWLLMRPVRRYPLAIFRRTLK